MNSLLLDFIREMDEKRFSIYGIIVLQNGKQIASHRWRSNDRVNLYSVSKSFTSVGIGIARDEGLLDLDEKVAPLFPDKLPENPDPRVFDLTIRHLLTMSVGHKSRILHPNQPETYTAYDWERLFFSQAFAHNPGESFLYNNGCSYMLSAILTKKTGLPLVKYLGSRLFDVLSIGNPQWFSCPRGISIGANGLFLTTDELSRFGQVMLNGGVYDGRRIVSENYLAIASQKQIDTGQYGYGYHFWPCRRPGSYMAAGLYEQLAIAVPDKNAVLAMTAHVERENEQVQDALWKMIDNL